MQRIEAISEDLADSIHQTHRTSSAESTPNPPGRSLQKRARSTDPAPNNSDGPPTRRQKLSPRSREVTPGNVRAKLMSHSLSQTAEEEYLNGHPSSIEAGTVMLSRAEDSGGTRIVKLARGVPGSPAPSRTTPRGPKRASSENNSLQLPRGDPHLRYNDTSSQLLGAVGIAEVLEEDERPTFIIDLGDDAHKRSDDVEIIYANPALTQRVGLIELIRGVSGDPTQMLKTENTFSSFKAWALEEPVGSLAPQPVGSCIFAGYDWVSSVIRKRLRIFRGRYVPSISAELASENRPGWQQYRALPSSGGTPQHESTTSGYFGPRLLSRGTGTPGTGESSAHFQELTKHHNKPSSIGEEEPNPAANGDLRISDFSENQSSSNSERQVFPAPNTLEGFENMYVSQYSESGFFDWTRLPISPSLPAHVQFARGIDWGSTSLGPIEGWSADLRGMCNLIMASPHPAAMYWGNDHVAIYNEPYVLLAGKKHPNLMGMRYQDAWSEIWDAITDVFANAMTSAQATMKDDDCLFLHRNGYLEETYFSWSIIPLIGEDGSVVGLYNPAFEKTRRKIAERRMLTLREIGEKTAAARKVSEFWGLLLEGLEYNDVDAPLVVVYSLQDESSETDTGSGAGPDTTSTTSSQAWKRLCRFEGALGVSVGHPAAPLSIDLKTGKEGFAPYFRQAMTTNKPVVLQEEDGSLDMRLIENVDWRGFKDPSRVVVISPIHPTTGDSTLGFLIMGTNPRRPYDEDYDLFVQLLGRQLATSMASVVLFEEEIRRGERAAKMAAQDRINLSNQLAIRTQEAIESENKFTRMAELAPVGIFMADSLGNIVYSNDAWHDIANYPRDTTVADDWVNYVLEEDRDIVQGAWDKLTSELKPTRVEFRFKHPWRDEFGNVGATWVLSSSFPEKTEDGKLKGIFGSVTDISTQKFAEGLQKKRMEEAMELKSQQERFIDITSHEMRNPLSAILQCSDEIATNLTELKHMPGLTSAQIENIESNIDAAQTIILCGNHQRRIVDDVLTLSKLDSALLLVTPTDTQPVTVVQRALKMFDGELQNADINLDFQVHDSFHKLKVDWVRLDPSRLLQVLINLTTNAIKFTTTQDKKTIVMHIGASLEPPTREDDYNITYVPPRNPKTGDSTGAPDWGTGEPVYLHFAVQDTGRGLTESEIKTLFQRFSQASPRTHVTYGGSGLGLFISRQLVELQGGQIGVASEAGKGSTFAFYIKSRRTSAPIDNTENENIDFLSQRKGSGKAVRPGSNKSSVALLSLPESNQTSGEITPPIPSPTKASADVLKVLVVEDNLVNQKVLAKQLRKAGCIVHLANHGGEAIEQIQRSTFWHSNASNILSRSTASTYPETSLTNNNLSTAVPDILEINIVLLDLEMPIMDGQTCARMIRKYQLEGKIIGHVPVIAVTANAREEQIKNTLEAGIDDVVSKPFRVVDLLPKVRKLIRKAREEENVVRHTAPGEMNSTTSR